MIFNPEEIYDRLYEIENQIKMLIEITEELSRARKEVRESIDKKLEQLREGYYQS
jgi:hypothetical protein